jgi:hypothetical protein
MTSMAEMMPISMEPVSPIKILAGVILYRRNAMVAPANEKAMMAKSVLSIRKNHVPHSN